MKNAACNKIFISYRVQDTAGETGRLVDALKQYFTDDQLFMDIENLEPGADFVDSIEHSLDSCDVFLAVIGPHWIGNRGGGDIRINDPNDWVRMEVGTALQRNIRVVPVLVDGGTLPPAEQLPPDLQPLLRRQAIEISNKRWRYDTDQLIKFLVQKAGIQPLKAKAQKPPASQDTKNRKTWIYVGAGFALAFVVLLVIGLLLPENEKEAATTTDTSQHTQQPSTSPPEQTAVIEPISSGSNTEPEKEKTTTASASLIGRWKEIDEGITSTFILKQSGSTLNVQVELNGEVIGTGTGTAKQKNVELNFLLFGLPTVLKATLSDDGNSMNGNYFLQTTGEQQPIRLVKQSN